VAELFQEGEQLFVAGDALELDQAFPAIQRFEDVRGDSAFKGDGAARQQAAAGTSERNPTQFTGGLEQE